MLLLVVLCLFSANLIHAGKSTSHKDVNPALSKAPGGEPSICEQLVSGATDVGVCGSDRRNSLLLDSKQWRGYYFKSVHQHVPPFTWKLYPSDEVSARDVFGKAWIGQSKFPGKVANTFQLEAVPRTKEVLQRLISKLYGTRGVHVQFEPPHNQHDFVFDPEYDEVYLVKPDPKLANVLLLGSKSESYTWGLTKNKSMQACLVKILFTPDLSKVERLYQTDRCIALKSPVRLGYQSPKTGFVTLFHADRTVSTYDTPILEFKLLENKPYSEYFVCVPGNSSKATTKVHPGTSESSKSNILSLWICGVLFVVMIFACCLVAYTCMPKARKGKKKKKKRKHRSKSRSKSPSKRKSDHGTDSKSVTSSLNSKSLSKV